MTRNSLTRRPDDSPKPRGSLTQWVMNRSRLTRTGYVFIGALSLALLLMPVVDLILFRVFGLYIGQSTGSSWAVLILCMGMYFSGYGLVIGLPGEKPPVSRAQHLYIHLVPFVLVLAVVWYAVQFLSIASGA